LVFSIEIVALNIVTLTSEVTSTIEGYIN